MILTDIDRLGVEARNLPALNTALAWLKDAARRPPQDGRVELDGSRVFAIVQTYTTKDPAAPLKFEAHRKYADIQFILAGRERCGWAPLNALAATTHYDEAKDIVFGEVKPESHALLPLAPGHAAVFFPSDAHAPGLAWGTPDTVRKIVIKIAAGLLA